MANEARANDTLAAWLRGSGYFTDPRPTLSTPQALAQSENLYLLRDPALRTAITAMIDRVEQVQSRLIPFEQRIFAATRRVDEWIDPADRGLTLSVGMIDPEVDALRSASQATVSVDLLPIVRRTDFLPVFLEIFWSHENLLWYQRELVRATAELRNVVETNVSGR